MRTRPPLGRFSRAPEAGPSAARDLDALRPHLGRPRHVERENAVGELRPDLFGLHRVREREAAGELPVHALAGVIPLVLLVALLLARPGDGKRALVQLDADVVTRHP